MTNKLNWKIKDYWDSEFVAIEDTSSFVQKKIVLSTDFIEWFRGFTDAEGSFIIQNNTRLTKDHNFKFIFRICLHIDDKAVLDYIKNTLQIGNVRVNFKTSEVTYEVSAQSDIEIILAIFTKFNLNTTKYLNFTAFKKAFLLFVGNNNLIKRKELKPVIKSIMQSMNKQRIDFILPLNYYNVSSYWLLGFVEGDGSFFFSTSNESLVFTISQKGNEALMRAIGEFLHNLVPLNLKNEKGFEGWIKINRDHREVFNLIVQRGAYIEFVLIPLFDSLMWHSKKYLDYKDWKSIFNIYKKGFNYISEGESLIRRILSQMNNNRLSTTKGTKLTKLERDLLLTEVTKLLDKSSNYEIKEGRVFIKSLNRFKGSPSSKQVQLLDASNDSIIHTFFSIVESARFLDIIPQTARLRVLKNTRFLFNNKLVYLK